MLELFENLSQGVSFNSTGTLDFFPLFSTAASSVSQHSPHLCYCIVKSLFFIYCNLVLALIMTIQLNLPLLNDLDPIVPVFAILPISLLSYQSLIWETSFLKDSFIECVLSSNLF